jgi:hypothetical protein
MHTALPQAQRRSINLWACNAAWGSSENEQITGLICGAPARGTDHVLSAEYLYANNTATSRVAAAPTSYLMPPSASGGGPVPHSTPRELLVALLLRRDIDIRCWDKATIFDERQLS